MDNENESRFQCRTLMEIQRKNILLATRCTVRELLDYLSMNHQTSIDYEDDVNLMGPISPTTYIVSRLLCAIEHGICHGLLASRFPSSSFQLFLRSKPALQSQNNHDIYPWQVIRCIPKMSLRCKQLVNSVDQLEEVSTGLGKIRILIRKALMSKVLGTLLREIIDSKETPCQLLGDASSKESCINSLYCKGALLMSDEGVNFSGLLLGLSVIDFFFFLRDNLKRLDRPLDPIDFNACFQSHFQNVDQPIPLPHSEIEKRLEAVIDQKSYLEEALLSTQSCLEQSLSQRKSLASTVDELRRKIKLLENEHTFQHQEFVKLKQENERILNMLIRQSKASHDDLQTVRETFRVSTSTLDNRNAELEMLLSQELKKAQELQNCFSKENEMRLSLEARLEKAETISTTQQRELSEKELQNATLVTVNASYVKKISTIGEELQKSRHQISQLLQKTDGMNSIISVLNERCQTFKEENARLENALRVANAHATNSEQKCIELEANLSVNRELTRGLCEKLDGACQKLTQSDSISLKYSESCEQLQTLQKRLQGLTARCEDQETGLAEMAQQVAEGKLEVDSLREQMQALSSAKWCGDSEMNACNQCATPFTLSRRKHHCRSCGLIFCYECSAYRMPLPSSSKPVRVCELCHNQLLLRYTAK